jgi:signal transduction histidine kinase
MDRSHHRLETGVVAGIGGGLTLLAAVITLEGSDSRYDWLAALARAFMVATPIAVGLYARQRPSSRRFGGLLLVSGLLLFVTTLAESASPLLYGIGRSVAWLVDVWLVFVILAFPTGRLRGRVDRLLVIATGAVAATLYLPTAFVVEAYPLPNPWTSCQAGCPANALMLFASEPAWIEDIVRPLRELLTAALFIGVTLRLAQRLRGATRLTRLMLTPVLAVAMLRVAVFSAALLVRLAAPESDAVVAMAWLLALGVPLLALAFVVALARWRVFDSAAMRRLAARLRARSGPEELRAALAEAFDDPSMQIAYRLDDDHGWTDASGARMMPALEPGPGRCVTLIRDGDRVVAALIHDTALREDRAFIDSATAYALMTLDNQRLAAQASSLVREIDASRARIQRTADEERRRIERDLHDGAQQRLVALRIQLELAAERLDGREHEAANLRELGAEVERALDEVRSLARGIYPAPLADRGLVEALRAAARQSPLPATVLATGTTGRYPAEVESAAYFCCLEALQNAAKHARGASAVVVELHEDDVLRFEVRDDGAGFDPQHVNGGVGMTSMRDRLGAVGGDIAIVSSLGHGTRLIGRIPVRARKGVLATE